VSRSVEQATAVTVRPYTPADAPTWDALVERSRSRHFFFKRGYMEYHADRFTDASLIVLDGERLVGVLPASRAGDTVVSHAGLTFGGLVSEPSLTTRRSLAALTAVRAHLERHGVRELIYKPVPHIYHVVPNEEDLYALFVLGARLARRDVSCAIRPGVRVAPTKGRRASLAQTRRLGLEIGASADFAEFMALETEALARRHGVKPVHTGEEMELLARRFPKHIGLHVARRGTTLLAGVLIYETETVAHAQYIAASVEGLEAHAIDAVLEDLLNDRYRNKRFLDFGISTEQDGLWLNEGLMRNKESFGARAVVYDWYTLDCSSSA
jgi:Acetyltransferase (GNAT) domain